MFVNRIALITTHTAIAILIAPSPILDVLVDVMSFVFVL